jgi:hypothetical protein
MEQNQDNGADISGSHEPGLASRPGPPGFDPGRECNILGNTQQNCPRHGHSHAPYGIAPPPWILSDKDTNVTRDILAASAPFGVR